MLPDQIFDKRHSIALFGSFIVLAGFFLFPNYRFHSKVFYGLVLLPFLMLGWRDIWLLIKTNRLMQLVVVFVAYSAISAFWSGDEARKASYKGIVYAVYILALLWAWCLSANSFLKSSNIVFSVFGLCGIAAITSLITIVADTYGLSEIRADGRLENFLSIENLNYLAHGMGWAAVVSGYYCLKSPKTSAKVYFALCLLAILAAIYMFETRAVLVGFSAVFLMLAGLHFLQSKKKAFLTLGVMVVGLTMIIWLGGEYFERLLQLQNYEQEWRYKIYKSLLAHLTGHFWYGQGLFAPTDEASLGLGYPHSMYMSTLFASGLVGLGLLLLLIAYTCIQAVIHINLPNMEVSLLLFVFGCATLLFDGFWLLDHVNINWLLFWVPMGMILASFAQAQKDRQSS